jgi:hypothetical protein
MRNENRLTIHSYGDNTPSAHRDKEGHVRTPLVHLLHTDDWSDTQSISFPPEKATEIAEAILMAAARARSDVDSECRIKWVEGDDEG